MEVNKMTKYRVTMMDKIFYEVYVEADDEGKAKEIAETSLDKAQVCSDSYIEIVDVEEAK